MGLSSYVQGIEPDVICVAAQRLRRNTGEDGDTSQVFTRNGYH